MIHHVKAENATEIARLLRSRGRIVITAPAGSGKTVELLRYAEERYPNGRFAVVARSEDHPYIINLHWQLHNNLSPAQVVAARLLGQELEGEDVNPPYLLNLDASFLITPGSSQSLPVFCDQWNLLPEGARRAIIRRQLFIAAVTSPKGETDGTEES